MAELRVAGPRRRSRQSLRDPSSRRRSRGQAGRLAAPAAAAVRRRRREPVRLILEQRLLRCDDALRDAGAGGAHRSPTSRCPGASPIRPFRARRSGAASAVAERGASPGAARLTRRGERSASAMFALRPVEVRSRAGRARCSVVQWTARWRARSGPPAGLGEHAMKPSQKVLNGHPRSRSRSCRRRRSSSTARRRSTRPARRSPRRRREGAQIIVFSEAWIAGYPYWGEGWESRVGDWMDVRGALLRQHAADRQRRHASGCATLRRRPTPSSSIGCNEMDPRPGSAHDLQHAAVHRQPRRRCWAGGAS